MCPHYTYRVAPDYVFRKAMAGTARAPRFLPRARNIVRNQGFRNVDRVECNGATYTFRGTRGGKRYAIYVNARTAGCGAKV